MLWFWLPVLLILIVVCAWIAVAVINRRGGDGVLKQGRTGYDRDPQKKSPDSPPA
jgi:hypothetical protein